MYFSNSTLLAFLVYKSYNMYLFFMKYFNYIIYIISNKKVTKRLKLLSNILKLKNVPAT